jgi:hypothetical protein
LTWSQQREVDNRQKIFGVFQRTTSSVPFSVNRGQDESAITEGIMRYSWRATPLGSRIDRMIRQNCRSIIIDPISDPAVPVYECNNFILSSGGKRTCQRGLASWVESGQNLPWNITDG